MTAGFLKRLAGAGEVSAVGSAVREIVASGGAGWKGLLKPVTDAVAIVEAKDTRLYYTRLQPEERAVVAGIVRAITGSEELGVGVRGCGFVWGRGLSCRRLFTALSPLVTDPEWPAR